MDVKEIQELLKLVNRLELAEFRYKQGDMEFSVTSKFYTRTKPAPDPAVPYVSVPSLPAVPPPAPPAAAQAPARAASDEPETSGSVPAGGGSASGNLVEIRSPIVGTFYRSSSPDKPPFAKPGDTISVGSVVCIIEAMKLFNEIESEV